MLSIRKNQTNIQRLGMYHHVFEEELASSKAIQRRKRDRQLMVRDPSVTANSTADRRGGQAGEPGWQPVYPKDGIYGTGARGTGWGAYQGQNYQGGAVVGGAGC